MDAALCGRHSLSLPKRHVGFEMVDQKFTGAESLASAGAGHNQHRIRGCPSSGMSRAAGLRLIVGPNDLLSFGPQS
jgi:hypothetical protein